MTVRLGVFYKQPEDPETFQKRYVEEHLPLAQGYQGITATSFHKVTRNLIGESPYAFLFVGTWDSAEDFKAAMGSDHNKDVTAHAASLGVPMDVVMLETLDKWEA